MNRFSVLSWNIQGETNITGHTSLSKIKPHLSGVNADILALQEVPDTTKLFSGTNVLNRYNLFVPKSNIRRKGFNYNIILSKYPITKAGELVFPNLGQKRKLEHIAKADIKIASKKVRIYNCHFPIFRAGPALRLKLLEYIFKDARDHNGPVIVCGDLNTTIPVPGLNRSIINAWHMEPLKDNVFQGKYLSGSEPGAVAKFIGKHGYKEALKITTPTWSPLKSKLFQLFNLKLDWFMVRELETQKVTLENYVSDHRAIRVEF